MGKSRRSRATEFGKCVRENIKARDGGCIFCKMKYRMPEEGAYGTSQFQIMHFIPRSQGGRGIQENGAVGCLYHHEMLDNGKGTRKEMLELFEGYLKERYPLWDKMDLYYRKGMRNDSK